MEIQKFFFKLVVSLLFLLAVYFQTSLQQQPASAPAVSIALAPDDADAHAPDNGPQKPFLAPEEVDAVHALLDLEENKPQISFSKSSCDSDAYRSFISCDCPPWIKDSYLERRCLFLQSDVLNRWDAVKALLKLMDNKRMEHKQPNVSISKICHSETYWGYFKCDCNSDTTCRVTGLDLSHQGVQGRIPEEIGTLSYLQFLDLSNNILSGTVPESLANLSKLKEIDLSNNQLEGHIPHLLFKMKSLRYIDLSVNFFNGTIPSQLDALPFLYYLDLSNNLLSGEIPKELGNISSLLELGLYDNMLRGELPDELGNLSNLSVLFLANNEFSGSLPSSFGKLKSLIFFNVRGNNLSGKFPDIVFSWQQLGYLSLIGNNFEAPLPDKFGAWENIQRLHITDLTRVNQDSKFPDVSKLSSLRNLTLRNCSLGGPIHSSLWKLPNLEYLDLSFNKLSGGVPPNIGKSSLNYLYLRSNEFNESLPKWMTENKTIHVDISENKFSNLSIPTGKISNNTNLFACCSGSNITDKHKKWMKNANCPDETSRDDNLYINCGGNITTINGSNYEADFQQEGGSTFFLSNSKRWGYSSMGTFLSTKDDLYILRKTCNLTMVDAPLYQTARIAPISLKYYGFCLKKNTYIVKLHFAEIGWDEIQFGVKNRRSFDVKIQGETYLKNFSIEAEAAGVDLDVTKEFTVQVNDTLEIHLYWSGEGSVYWPTTYFGPLISAISVSPVPKKHKKLSTAAIAGIGSSAALCVILTLVLFRLLGWFGGKKLQDEELKVIELYPGGYFNFRDIKAATQNFDASSKLGEGGFGAVYKGVLPNGTEIAVKQLSARSRQGIHEFVNEIGTISALQHPNLVRLMGCCAEDYQLLLIYEYMENNSLAHALFGDEEKKLRLNWTRRIKICLGIAKGLAFLHEESKLKIIHRDIKATNILLDKDLNAKISDFGFAKLFEEEDTHVITRIAGTLGYMAPEYAMRGHLTTKADVYSFGVVTLEIVSGKSNAICRPNDRTIFLLDLAYVSKEQGNLLALVDPNLGSEYSLKEATTLLELAILCTNQSPTLRPTMSEVVNILEGKSEIKAASTSVPYSTNSFTMAKTLVSLSESPESGSYLEGGASGSTVSHSISKEIEESSFSAYHSAKTVM